MVPTINKTKDRKMTNTNTLRCVCHGHELTAAVDELPQASINALLQYGFQRFINDRANQGGKEVDTAYKHGVADAVLAQLKEGWQGRAVSVRADPRETVGAAMLKKAIGKKAWDALGEERQATALAAYLVKFASAIDSELARREESRRAARALSGGVDLGALLEGGIE